MTTSPETARLDHDAIHTLLLGADALALHDRMTLLKGLIPGVAREMSPMEFQAFVVELRLKGERFYDATMHPGRGREERHVIGERDLEGR